ncbi:MAG: asparagine synthase (glutamine-hydrolyzing) [bacterium]
MCGIAGAISNSTVSDADNTAAFVQRACGVMAHRGPDADGFWSDGQAMLGHRRLAIIDLTAGGRQPMTNEDGTLWITFNGEIYNFQELRDELAKAGHSIKSQSDTEVILHAYEQWGERCVERFRGMFAFAIWDTRKKRLFAARDRVGKKPFFYHWDGQTFRFASEIAAIVSDSGVSRRINPSAIDYYLTWGYIPAPMTPYADVHKLPPAHTLVFEASDSGWLVTTNKYWQLAYSPKSNLRFEDACEEIRLLLTEAVRLRMISDVPLGAFLSGGIDSSIIVGLMAGLSSRPVKTFSIGFRESRFNELDHARRIASRWGTEHHEFIVEPDAVGILPNLVRHYGEPYADSSAIPTYYVSKVTREHVTVALNGDGGDEGFLGYERYLANGIAEKLSRIPGSSIAVSLAGKLIPGSTDSKNVMQRIKRFLKVASMPERDRYAHWIGYFGQADKNKLYKKGFSELVDSADSLHWYERLVKSEPGLSAIERANLADIQSYLPYDLLVKVDIASMACSLEARSPLLDHKVLEFGARLPVEFKLQGKKGKQILRQAFSDLLPPENVNRRKAGFGVPVGDWFRGPMQEMLRQVLGSKSATIRGYLAGDEIDRLLHEHVSNRQDHTFKVWNLLMLELWHQEFNPSPDFKYN